MLAISVAVLLVAVTACSGETDPSTPADSTSPPATVPERSEIDLVLGPAAPTIGAEWTPLVTLTYGDAEENLGLSDTHGGATPGWGPEYLAPAADGTLWVLDVNKHRVARFSNDGRYLGATAIPGLYAGLQMPFMLGDTFWASGSGPDGALVIDGGGAARVGDLLGWDHSDGSGVYNAAGTSRLTPGRPPTISAVGELRTPSGTPYRVDARPNGNGTILVSLPDAQREVLLRVASGISGGPLEVLGYEFVSDDNDRVSFLAYGLDNKAQEVQLAGYFSIDARSGEVSAVEPMRDPFSEADPGSPAHLRAVPDEGSILLTFVDEDAVHVYKRM